MTTIGVDFGTSNSGAAAVLRGGRPMMIPSAEGVSLGGKAFPSYVAVTADGQLPVGEPARRQAAANPDGTVTGLKRKMGQRVKIRLRDKECTPELLAAFLLQKIKRDAEAFLGEPVTQAVVTVPAYFDDNQRSASKDACAIAGREVARLVHEPTAASLAYELDRASEELRIAVVDVGGGTLDVTILEVGQGVFEVEATSGDTQLGGSDMDQRVSEHLADRFHDQTGIDVRMDPKASARLREAAEIAKVELPTSTTTHVSLPYLGATAGEPQHLELDLTRTELERLTRPVIERCRSPVEQALGDADVTPAQIDRIVFVGEPTRMPAVRGFSEKIFGRQAEMGVDPMECVASGAAIKAGVLTGELGEIVLVDVTPLTLGVETLGGIATPLIERNSPIPVRKSEDFTTAAHMQTAVTVHVVQGERPMAADNTSRGQFNLEGIPPASRGGPKIEVAFDIDADGILDVTAKDTATGRSQSIRITGSTRLSEADKTRMVEEGERYAEEDRRRENAERLNNADAVCYQAERTLADLSDKIAAELRSRIEPALRETRQAIGSGDAVEATTRAELLECVLQEVGAAMYAQAAPGAKAAEPEQSQYQGGHLRAEEIAEAYAVLSDPKNRATYDAHDFPGMEGLSAEDLMSGIDFAEIFGDLGFPGADFGGGLFERMFGRRRASGPPRGADLQGELTAPLTRVLIGGAEQVTVQRPGPCESCAGSGAEPGTEPRTCETGHGMPSPAPGGLPGDAYVVVHTARDPRFVRRGPDLWRTEVISVPDVVLGTTRVAPTLAGEVTLTIPPGTRSGAVLRVPAQGLPSMRAAGRGELDVSIMVRVPERLHEDERRLYEQRREHDRRRGIPGSM